MSGGDSLTVNQMIIDALSPILPVHPVGYKGEAKVYAILSVSTPTYVYGDDEPVFDLHQVTVEVYCPMRYNSIALRRDVANALGEIGECSFPSIGEASDDESQCFPFELELVLPHAGVADG